MKFMHEDVHIVQRSTSFHDMSCETEGRDKHAKLYWITLYSLVISQDLFVTGKVY